MRSRPATAALIFLLSFLSNWAWEYAHAPFYASYQGGAITAFVLFRAAAADAVMITLIALPFVAFAGLRKRSWMIAAAGVVIAVTIEWYALAAGRWSYNERMPIVPLLGVGLTPAVQIGILGYLSYWLAAGRSRAET